ncbi:dihydrodipicolinate synthase family protein [Vibrio neptunius]|uniref:dihydrodipicolinate synthase family protein n=1 Tax=Vibrio neptunius TaxID=170651 RepID=UPI0019D2DA64|nr:dihydrodipicolinate synthase family protein [Vibrio neptunius]MBN3571811.1 dihydrodipicolinate synthase family protein [Vibrio neptunius]
MIFQGISAFPITPISNEQVDTEAYYKILGRLVDAKVDSICALGSTGLYPYLNAKEKHAAISTAVEMAGSTPVLAGIGALRLRDVLANAQQAEQLGVKGLLLAPLSYQRLFDEEVYELYRCVSDNVSVPICVYDNPSATHFTFSDQLHAEIAKLKMVQSIKFPGAQFKNQGQDRVQTLKELVPEKVTIGVSGDAFASMGIQSGCDVWYSVLAGLFPRTAKHLFEQAKQSDPEQAKQLSLKYEKLWQLFSDNLGGMRVMVSAAELLGYAESPCLPAPLTGLDSESKLQLKNLISELDLA